jgi:hypothetical protein
MSPSVVQGVVEIGVGVGPLSWDREGMEERDKNKNKRGFSALFCRRRGRENVL